MIKLVTTALQYYGTNPQKWTFPWCAAFGNFVLAENGIGGTDSNMARSFLTIGRPTDTPRLGDIVILWRIGKDTPWGHNGFFIAEDDYWITLLGGNQDETVKIKRYPKWQLLGTRRINV